MRIFAYVLLSFFVAASAWASDSDKGDGLLNKVIFKLNAEQWVASKTALVTIAVNASVSDTGLEKIQDEVIKKLNQISNQGEWHLVTFDRSLDQSGLEKVQITAEARLASSALVGLRDKTKATSKPGETFTLDNIRFTPNEDEIRAANTVLRNNVYEQAKDETDRLNRLFPDQKYFIHSIDFINNVPVSPLPQTFMAMKAAGGNGAEISVGDKLVLSATVVLSAVPDHSLIKNIT